MFAHKNDFTTLITNTKGDGKFGDEFWTKADTLLYCALIGYIHYEAPPEEQNFTTLLEFINAMEVREDDEEYKNPVDRIVDDLAEKDPNHFAVRQYMKYRLAAGKTAKSILISCGASGFNSMCFGPYADQRAGISVLWGRSRSIQPGRTGTRC